MGRIDGAPSADDDQAITDTKNDLGHGLLGAILCLPSGEINSDPPAAGRVGSGMPASVAKPRSWLRAHTMGLADVAIDKGAVS